MARNNKSAEAQTLLEEKRRDAAFLEQKSIGDMLSTQYAPLIIKVSTQPDDASYNSLINILVHDKDFSGFKSVHGDEEGAKQFVDNFIGAGIIPKIQKEYPDVTDISWNGRFLTVATNNRKFVYARLGKSSDGQDGVTKPDGSPLDIIDDDYIYKLVNRFANRLGKRFDDQNPKFDGFVDNFRISANHESLTPEGYGYTMSLRISRASKALNRQNFNNFAPISVLNLLTEIVKAHNNIIISGETGTGKTELLKLLIEPIPFRDKIIMIEDVAETHLPEIYPQKDIFDWLTSVSEKHDGSGEVSGISIEDHVKSALRNQPNWLLVSETRGGEAADMFDSVLSGHNIITTLHAISNDAVPDRFVGMVLQSESGKNRPMEDLKNSFYRYMGFGIHIRRKFFPDGKLLRYMQELVHFSFESLRDPNYMGVNPIFRQYIEQREDGVYRVFQRWPLEETVSQQIRLANNLTSKQLHKIWTLTAKTEINPKTGKPQLMFNPVLDANGQPLLDINGKQRKNYIVTSIEEKLEI